MRAPLSRRLLGLTLSLVVCAAITQVASAQTVQGFEPGDPALTNTSGDAGTKGTYQGQAPDQGTTQYLITTIRATDNEDGITNQSGSDAATFAAYNAAIFNGSAPAGGDGSGILVPFTIGPSGAIQLTLRYDFLSNEPGQTTPRNDFAVAGIFNSLNVLQGSVNTFATVTGSSFGLMGAGDFVFHTGYQTLTLSLVGLAPGNYNLALGVEDRIPGADHATGLLIDNIAIVVPEPSTVGLGIAGMALLLALRKRFKRA